MTTGMSKKDLILAQRTLAARKVRLESKGETLLLPSPIKSSSRGLQKSILTKSIDKNSNSVSFNQSHSAGNDGGKEFSEYLAEHNSDAGDQDSNDGHQPMQQTADELIKELAERSMTSRGGLRKMQQTINKKMKQNKNGKSSIKFDDNYFMPKVTICRPDGSTLSSIYQSKREDTWSHILKAQLKEEEEDKIIKKINKAKADEEFGILLKKQLQHNERRMKAEEGRDDHFAIIEEQMSKKSDDIQKQRKADAINRQKQFIQHALDDIETKKKKREKLFISDMEASQMMISKSNYLQEVENKKNADKKETMAKNQAKLFLENLASLEKKEKEKLLGFEEDKRINRETILKYKNEDERRARELASVLNRTSDGPVHRINREIVESLKEKTTKFETMRMNINNGLNAQLQQSEDFANSRKGATGKYLMSAWDETIRIHKAEEAAENKNIERIGEVMKAQIKRTIKEDEAKKEKQKQEHQKYKEDLDAQLKIVRQRSLNALTKTMSNAELLMNNALIKKTGLTYDY